MARMPGESAAHLLITERHYPAPELSGRLKTPAERPIPHTPDNHEM
jgi:hypothetical protein